jgi:hypothetical protein
MLRRSGSERLALSGWKPFLLSRTSGKARHRRIIESGIVKQRRSLANNPFACKCQSCRRMTVLSVMLSLQITSEFQTLPHGPSFAQGHLAGGTKMPPLPKRDDQARLLIDIADVGEKKRKLEEYIKTLESLNNSLLESAAYRDIEAYKNRAPVVKLAR